MTAAPLESLLAPAGLSMPGATVPGVPNDAVDFAAMLQKESVARDAATKLVSSTLVLPILASMRESEFLEGPFKPGVFERRFAPLLDQEVADSITTSSNFNLVDSIVKQIESGVTGTNVEITA